MVMQYGFVFPGGAASQQLELAVLAEEAGWDGVFVWEAAFGVDAWSLLSAIAVRTERIRLGTLLTPLPFRRPWKVASQLMTLDQLSGGRAILSVGLGAMDPALGETGEVADRRVRAQLLDEGLDIIDALFDGTYRTEGERYRVDFTAAVALGLTPRPRPPIWIVGLWNAPKSMRRVLRGDGLLPNVPGGPGADVLPFIADMRRWLDDSAVERGPLDLIGEGQTPHDDAAAAAATVAEYEAAGATWWIENRWGADQHGDETMREVRRRLEAGPPRSPGSPRL